MRRRWLALAAAAALLVLGGCADTSKGPLWTPDSPRNGATQPVDPALGTPIPGYPQMNGA
jgi:predicted small lipoprotein YifL